MKASRAQSGAALVVVILLVAVISVIAVTINEQVRFSSQRLLNQRFNEQGYWYVMGGEALVQRLLEEADLEKVNLGQDWATREAVFPIEGGVLMGRIDDRQACFNVNNLFRQAEAAAASQEGESISEKQLASLFALLGIEGDVAQQLRDRLRDWIDSDQIPSGLSGAEDLHYSALKPAYQTANQLMVSATEMALLAPLDDEQRGLLKQQLCALPEFQTAVNINTLTEEQAVLLAALLNQKISVEEAKELIRKRPENGWDSVEALMQDSLLADREIDEGVAASLGVTSSFFRATIDVSYHENQLRLYSMLRVAGKKAVVYAREYGELF